MAKTKIPWSEESWNTASGCTKLSEGCQHCYAEREAKHLQGMGMPKYKQGFKVALHPDTLDDPYHWRKPRLVFVDSMSDFFHKDIPLSYIKKVFRVMNDNPKQTFQVLTKRVDRLEQLSPELNWTPNIWGGVTVESDKHYDRISHLLNTDAAVKFLSCEPLLSPLTDIDLTGIDWVICGGESGSGFREMKAEWALELRDICQKEGVAFFFKQWSGFHTKKLGCLLDGREYKQFPKVLSDRMN